MTRDEAAAAGAGHCEDGAMIMNPAESVWARIASERISGIGSPPLWVIMADHFGDGRGGLVGLAIVRLALEEARVAELRDALERIAETKATGPHPSPEDGMASALAALDRCRDLARDALKDGSP